MSERISDDVPAAAETGAGPTLLLQWLGEANVACPTCGYDLHRLTVPRCPECGSGLRLALRADSPGRRAWVVMLIGTLIPAGPGLIIGAMMVRGLVEEGLTNTLSEFHRSLVDAPIQTLFAAFGVLYCAFCVPAAVFEIVARRRIL
jgi:hypothetical protein